MNIFNKQRWASVVQLSVGILAVLLYLLPYFIQGQDAPMLVHDNLDQAPVQYSMIYKMANPFWNSADNMIPIMNGAPITADGPNFRLNLLPYYFLPPFAAYVLLQVLTRIIAFIGMWLLLRTLYKSKKGLAVVSTGVAILFAMLPHYPPTIFTVPGLPLLTWVFVCMLQRKTHWGHWLILLALPFFTSFLLAPVFLLVILGIVWFWDAVFHKRVNWVCLGGLVWVGSLYILASYPIILSAFGDAVVSHRSVRAPLATTDLIGSVKEGIKNFLEGQYHVATRHRPLIPLFVITCLVALVDLCQRLFKAVREKSGSMISLLFRNDVGVLTLVALAGVISFWYGFYKWLPFCEFRVNHMPTLNMLNTARFHWLHPLLWYVALAGVLFFWRERFPKARYVGMLCVGVMVMQGVVIVKNADYLKPESPKLSWREFFAEKQFEEIKLYIGRPQNEYRVASLGIHPSIALFNGFYCLDGYSANYKLSYHSAFRKVIAPELSKDEMLEQYFDTWGNRCYFFSSELGKDFVWTKATPRVISGLAYDWNQFADLGGRYILSAVEIKKPEDSGLEFIKVFAHPDSAWEIRLYAPMGKPEE